MREQKNNKNKFNWPAVGAVILILLLLVWFLIADSDGDPNNGFILPLLGKFLY